MPGKRSSMLLSWNFFLPFLLLVAISAGFVQAEEAMPTGEQFSDPQELRKMPEGWRQQAVQYVPELRKADLVVNLDQSVFPSFQTVVNEFAKKNKLKLVLNSGTCGITNRVFLHKQVDVGSYCCPPGKDDRMPGVVFHTLALAPIALIVHPDNPIENISFAEAQKLFAGDIRRWSEVQDKGGRKYIKPVQPVSFIHCKKRPGHWRLLLDNDELFSPRTINVTSIPDMVYTIASNNKAIGHEVSWLALKRYRKEKGQVKPLKIDGLDPLNLQNLAQGKYPLYRTYTLASWGDPHTANPLAGRLIHHLITYAEKHAQELQLVPPSQLKGAGWQFQGAEVVGMPKKK